MDGRNWTLVFAIFSVFSVAVPARAAGHVMTVSELQHLCTASDEGSKSVCEFYILGIAQGAALAANLAGDKTHFCLPDDTSALTIEFAVKKAIGEDLMFFPKDQDLPAVSFVAAAVQKAFPCR